MKFSRYALTALLLMLGAASTANSASVDQAFRTAVARILGSIRSEQQFLRDLSAAEFRDFVACAQNVMAAAPLARKQYVLAASNQSEMRQRFKEVSLDKPAVLQYQINSECA